MKKRKGIIVISVALALTAIFTATAVMADFSVSTIFSQLGIGETTYSPPSQIQLPDTTLTYEYTTSFEADMGFIPTESTAAALQMSTYSDAEGGLYTFDSKQRLYSYMAPDTSDQAVAVMSESSCQDLLLQFLEEHSISYEDYTDIEYLPSNLLTEITLRRPSDTERVDYIRALFRSNGSLSSVLIYHNDVDAVSDSDKAFFERELENYLNENGYTDTITDIYISYRRIENTLMAYYDITFQDQDGAFYTEWFSTGRDKLFW